VRSRKRKQTGLEWPLVTHTSDLKSKPHVLPQTRAVTFAPGVCPSEANPGSDGHPFRSGPALNPSVGRFHFGSTRSPRRPSVDATDRGPALRVGGVRPPQLSNLACILKTAGSHWALPTKRGPDDIRTYLHLFAVRR